MFFSSSDDAVSKYIYILFQIKIEKATQKTFFYD